MSAPVPSVGDKQPAKKRPTKPKASLARNDKRKYTTELAKMMHGFGDDATPLPDTVAQMELLVADFVHNLTAKTMKLPNATEKPNAEDLLFVVRKDRVKWSRARDALKQEQSMNKRHKTEKS